MLKIGKIPYLNVYPIFEGLKRCQFCEFVEGEPSYLNKKIYNGEIDIAPSSSLEYLKHRENYILLDEFVISSRKKILSVILVTEKKIEDLNENDTIYLSPSSYTSNGLLKIILFEFFKKFPKFQQNNTQLLNRKNQLIIGDVALKIYFRRSKNFYIYDLAEVWYNFTKLPFVFALWIVNKKNFAEKKEFIDIFKKILKKSIRSYTIPESYNEFTKNEIEEYFQYIEYNFLPTHEKSLKLFEELAKKWKII